MKKLLAVACALALLSSSSCSSQTPNPVNENSSEALESSPSGRIISAADNGILPDSGADITDAVNHLFQTLKSGDTVCFAEGTYEFDSPIKLISKKNITIAGENTVFIRNGVKNTDAASEDACMMYIYDIENVTVRGITLRYSTNPNISGVIENINRSDLYVDVRVSDGFDVTGNEFFMCMDTFDADGTPNYAIEHYSDSKIPVEITENGLLRIKGLTSDEINNAKSGDGVCLRAGLKNNAAFIITNSSGLCFEDMTVNNAFAAVFYMDICSNGAVFRRVKIQSHNPNALMSSNADGIHIAGLSGKLCIEDCEFYGLGDDCLNVHTRAGIAKSVDSDTVTVLDGYTKKSVENYWAKKGDTIEFLNADTLISMGTAVIKSVSGNGKYQFDSLPEGITDGAVLSNKTMHPSVSISGTTVRSNRARAFLLQTDDVTISNCNIYGTALAAILIAPDINYWYEVAPSHNVSISGNSFENCGGNAGGVVLIKASHDGAANLYPSGVHSDITVENNTFKNCMTSAVFGASIKGLTVSGNTFDNLTGKTSSRKYAVYAMNSDNITVQGNSLVGGSAELFDSKNSDNITVTES